jgi:hypothetical protein
MRKIRPIRSHCTGLIYSLALVTLGATKGTRLKYICTYFCHFETHWDDQCKTHILCLILGNPALFWIGTLVCPMHRQGFLSRLSIIGNNSDQILITRFLESGLGPFKNREQINFILIWLDSNRPLDMHIQTEQRNLICFICLVSGAYEVSSCVLLSEKCST